MRKLQYVLVAALLAGSATAATAQDQPPRQQGGPNRGNQMAALMQGITLTADQQTKIDTLTKKYADQRAALASLEQDERRAKSRELMTKQAEEVKAILTDEQKKVFEKNQADMAARMQGGGRPPQR